MPPRSSRMSRRRNADRPKALCKCSGQFPQVQCFYPLITMVSRMIGAMAETLHSSWINRQVIALGVSTLRTHKSDKLLRSTGSGPVFHVVPASGICAPLIKYDLFEHQGIRSFYCVLPRKMSVSEITIIEKVQSFYIHKIKNCRWKRRGLSGFPKRREM